MKNKDMIQKEKQNLLVMKKFMEKLNKDFSNYEKALNEKWESKSNVLNPHQRELDRLVERSQDFARLCGVPLWEDVVISLKVNDVIEKIEDSSKL